jgi:LuxR family maltose regulon positive regulatory protein
LNSLRILTRIFAGETVSAKELSESQAVQEDDFMHSLLHFNLGLYHIMQGETAAALEAFSETLRLSRESGNPLVTIVTSTQMGETRLMRGALGLAERAFRQAIEYTRSTLGERSVLLGMPYVSYASLLREQNRLEEAIRYAEQGIAHCNLWLPAASMDGQICMARILAVQGHQEQACQRLEAALKVAEGSSSVLDDLFVVTERVRLHLMQADLASARHWIESYHLGQQTEHMYFYMREQAGLVLTRLRVLELESDPTQAGQISAAINQALAESERRERTSAVIEWLVLQTYALHAGGDHTRAAESLSRALALGAQSGYRRIFADEGPRLLHLLEQYRARLHAPRTYLDEITALMRSEAGQPVSDSAPSPDPLISLTRRELEILQLLAAGHSNQEIANELVLALNTVKKHVGNILGKLGVSNRTQAVMLARTKSWIE